ncbi:MAG: T9SS type A sorting domain-containing protein [Gracilimonas sp.]
MNHFKILLPVFSLILFLSISTTLPTTELRPSIEKKAKTIEDRERTNKGRYDHFFRLMRDPSIDAIPSNVRSLELQHAEFLPSASLFKSFKNSTDYNFTEIGPYDVGGRTRALAVDIDDSDIILAGGVSGGVWRSTDAGDNWTLVTDPSEISSVTYLAQDPRNGYTDNWYFVTGEFSGNSASSRGGQGFYYGNGVYRSTDNGITWTQISSTGQSDNNTFNSPYDYISKVKVSPSTGSIFISSNGFGVRRSTDGQIFNTILGEPGQHSWADFDIMPDGDIVAVISQLDACGGCSQTNDPGVYLSSDDGDNWVDITPDFFPTTHARSIISVSYSSPNNVYVLSNVNGEPELSYIDLDSPANNEDRTDNLPDYGGSVGSFNLQGGYNMLLNVHPTDPDIVIAGGTNLYISFDGFTSPQPEDPEDMWIGGYSTENNVGGYPNHHADQHVISFDPTDPDRVWSGHDGGVSLTNSITTTPVSWTDKDQGYNVTQFYTAAIFPEGNDTRVVGGTQDNGSPFFNYDLVSQNSSSVDLSSGDGSYAAFTDEYAYVSSQNGSVLRLKYLQDGSLDCIFSSCDAETRPEWTNVDPADASGQLFIHPYKVDPVDIETMYYPEGDSIWRNTALSEIPPYENSSPYEGWSIIPGVGLDDPSFIISTLEVSEDNPTSLLYYAGYNDSGSPKLFKLPNANSSNSAEDISIAGAASGSYTHDIAINPTDADEVMVIFSNYGVPSIFHSENGGDDWTNVEGNLSGNNGPSVRTAAIIETQDGPVYFVGTSTGLYSTTELNGSSTVWTRQAENLIGKTVVEYLDLRSDDNVLAIATHGRGIFLGVPAETVTNITKSKDLPDSFTLDQNYPNPFNPTTSISFTLPSTAIVDLEIFDINGRKVGSVLTDNQMSGGSHQVNFNAKNLASGVYIYRISARSTSGSVLFNQSRSMTLIK